jgi:hypothetical protein
MAKLTKAQRSEIGAALSALSRGVNMIQNPRYSVARREGAPADSLAFKREAVPAEFIPKGTEAYGNYALSEINKEIGSDLCGLYDAQRTLQRLLSA